MRGYRFSDGFKPQSKCSLMRCFTDSMISMTTKKDKEETPEEEWKDKSSG